MKTYKGNLEEYLQGSKNKVLVFGSNWQGRHKAGVAKLALKFGAVLGQAKGRQGNTYAIVTKDLQRTKHPSVTRTQIELQIAELYRYAYAVNPEEEFVIPYTATGENRNGYSPEDMATMFGWLPIPDNIVFEESFATLIQDLSDNAQEPTYDNKKL